MYGENRTGCEIQLIKNSHDNKKNAHMLGAYETAKILIILL
jgi:hypothetical protein